LEQSDISTGLSGTRSSETGKGGNMIEKTLVGPGQFLGSGGLTNTPRFLTWSL